MKIAILGAGLAGLSTAYHLTRMSPHDTEWVTYEREAAPGGLCRSFEQDGFTFDLTGHLLHFKTEYARTLVHALLRDNLHSLNRNAWIYSHGRYSRYPFQANLHGLPEPVLLECLGGFLLAARLRKRKPQASIRNLSFQEWILATFGQGIARHFMIPYNRKLWGVDLAEMTCDWMGPYVPCPDLKDVLAGAAGKAARTIGYNAKFWYPLRGGIQVLPEALARLAGDVRLGKEVTRIDLGAKRITFRDGTGDAYDVLITSLPLRKLIELCIDVPPDVRDSASRLRHAAVLDINLGIDRPCISDKHWIYFPEDTFSFYRVGFPMNFSPHLCPRETSSMYVEVGYSPEAGIHSEAALTKAVRQLIRIGLLENASDIRTAHMQRIPFAYAVFDIHRRRAVPHIMTYLRGHDVYSIGRYGAWEYSAMEDALLAGKEVVDQLLMEWTKAGSKVSSA